MSQHNKSSQIIDNTIELEILEKEIKNKIAEITENTIEQNLKELSKENINYINNINLNVDNIDFTGCTIPVLKRDDYSIYEFNK
jgi:hypothetical protein